MLVVCSQCGRHARPAAALLCGAALVRPGRSVARRASRAGAFAAVAVAGIACGARTELGVPRASEDASVDVESFDAPSEGSTLDAPLVFYGGPFPDAGPPSDASTNADTGGIPLYGAPPPGD